MSEETPDKGTLGTWTNNKPKHYAYAAAPAGMMTAYRTNSRNVVSAHNILYSAGAGRGTRTNA